MIKLHSPIRTHREIAQICSRAQSRSISAFAISTIFSWSRHSVYRHATTQFTILNAQYTRNGFALSRTIQTLGPEDEHLQRVFKSAVGSSREVVQNKSQSSSTKSPQRVDGQALATRPKRTLGKGQHWPIAARLHTALDSKDLRWVLLLWHEARSNEHNRAKPYEKKNSQKPSIDKTPKTLSYSLCNQFLTAFMALKEPREAIQVWNYLTSTGRTPSQASWNAMLDGCKIARDIKSLLEVWEKMQHSGIYPDAGCWTTKISAFAQAGRFSQSVAALREMGMLWLKTPDAKRETLQTDQELKSNPVGKNAATGEVEQKRVVKPSIEALNATLSYVPKHINEREIDALMSWAQSFNLKPNIITYNSLIRAHVNSERNGRALQLLEEMDLRNVPPDVITYTIVLAGLLRNSDSMSSKDSTTIIGSLLAEMEGNGIEANAYSYGTIIHGLLKHHANVPAARAILDHMVARNIKPSPHIFTILVTHYFETRPLNLVALDELWDQILIQKISVDHIFYDIMIKGYAQAKEVNRMAATLREATLQRKAPGWDVLVAALRAFLESGDISRAKELVNDTEKSDRAHSPNRRMSKMQEEFQGIATYLRDRKMDA